MNVQRIDGIKYNLDTLTDNELTNIRGHLVETHARLTGEIALLESVMWERHSEQLQFEYTEPYHG